MRTSLTRLNKADLVQTTTRPEREERPALDFFRKESDLGVLRSYHFDDQLIIPLEALDVTCSFFKNKINFDVSGGSIVFSVLHEV